MSEEIIDVDGPTPEEALKEFNPNEVRDLGEPLEFTLRVYKPKDTLGGYVMRLIESDSEDGEIHSTLFSGEEHVGYNIGTHVGHYLEIKGF